LQLAAALDRSGSSRIIDGNVDRDFVNDSLRAMEQERFDAVGVGVMGGPQVATAIAVSKAIREHFPAAPIVWGGYFPTLHTDATLAAPYVDYAIRAQASRRCPNWSLRSPATSPRWSGSPGCRGNVPARWCTTRRDPSCATTPRGCCPTTSSAIRAAIWRAPTWASAPSPPRRR